MSVQGHYKKHSYVFIIAMTWLLFVSNGCKNGIVVEEDIPITVDYVCPYKSGIYHGTFKAVGGCYACIPYTDTTYQGDVAVKINENDTIEIKSDSYWTDFKFRCNVLQTPQVEWWRNGDVYIYDLGLGVHIRIYFIGTDSLIITNDQYGGGGYSQYSFAGK